VCFHTIRNSHYDSSTNVCACQSTFHVGMENGINSCICPSTAHAGVVGGVNTCICPAGQHVQGAECACNVAGQHVQGGQCLCPVGQNLCNSVCVDTTSSNSNCGSCGHACAANTMCVRGACASQTVTCPAGQQSQGGGCVAAPPREPCKIQNVGYAQYSPLPICSCGLGYHYDPDDITPGSSHQEGRCVSNYPHGCVRIDHHYDSTVNRCVYDNQNCPSGYSFSRRYDVCVPSSAENLCQNTYGLEAHYNPDYQLCDSLYVQGVSIAAQYCTRLGGHFDVQYTACRP